MKTLNDRTVKTRKPHQCFACLRQFPAGTDMRSTTIVDDESDMYTLYTCETCDDLIPKYKDVFADNDGGFPEGCVREVMPEFGCDTPEELFDCFRAIATT